MTTSPVAAVVAMQAYRAGRSPRIVQQELGVADADRLASNESPYGPLPSVIEALSKATESVNRYPGVRAVDLISEIARQHNIDVENVIAGPGSAGVLWQLATAYLGADRHMVSPTPSFEGYPLIAQLTGTRLTQVSLRDHTVHVSDLLDAIADDTALAVIAEPNNPTGTAVGSDALEDLIAGTRDRCLLVIDEAYVEFQAETSRSIERAMAEDHVVVLRTFSKAFGLAALRVGYAVGNSDVLSYIDRVAAPFSVTAHAEAAAIASLHNSVELAKRVGNTVAERERVADALRRDGWECLDSHTNFVFLPISDSATDIAAALERVGVITRPIAGIGLRVTIGSPQENDRFLAGLTAIAVARAGLVFH